MRQTLDDHRLTQIIVQKSNHYVVTVKIGRFATTIDIKVVNQIHCSGSWLPDIAAMHTGAFLTDQHFLQPEPSLPTHVRIDQYVAVDGNGWVAGAFESGMSDSIGHVGGGHNAW